LFVCTDNFTRSVIAEFCLRDYLKNNNIHSISVASAGIRADSDISKYSNLHFEIMTELGIDTTDFKRTMFTEESFAEYDVIIGMSPLHVNFIKDQFGKEIALFNELLDGSRVPVQVGAPDSEGFREQMKGLVEYIHSAMPRLVNKMLERSKANEQ